MNVDKKATGWKLKGDIGICGKLIDIRKRWEFNSQVSEFDLSKYECEKKVTNKMRLSIVTTEEFGCVWPGNFIFRAQ